MGGLATGPVIGVHQTHHLNFKVSLSMHLIIFFLPPSHLGHEHFGILGLWWGDAAVEQLPLVVGDLDGERHPPQRLLVLLLLVVDLAAVGAAANVFVVGDA